MRLAEAISQAFRLLWAHKGRSILTLFGLVWGTAAVIFLVGWGRGLTQMLEDGFYRAGKHMGQVWAGRIGEDFTPAVDRRYLWFVQEDVERVRRLARLPAIVAGETQQFMSIAFRQRALSTDVRGVEPEGIAIRGVAIASGRHLTRSDLDHRRRSVVLGDKTRRNLLGPEGGVGSRVRIGGKAFRVVGVLERVGTQLGRDGNEIDEQVWVPLSTFQAQWPRPWNDDLWVNSILFKLSDPRLITETEQEVRAIVAERLGTSPSDEEAVRAWSPMHMLNQIPLAQISSMLFLLAAATLVIGGVGTLNLMLDSVQERRQEIGVRLAVGARRRDVLSQFFLETFVVVATGGLTGVAVGVAGCLALGRLEVPDLVPVPILSLDIVVIALGVMALVGFGAGLIPAWRASRVDPAITLRIE